MTCGFLYISQLDHPGLCSLLLAAFDNYRWKLCSVFIIAHNCTIWQLPVFTSQQLHSSCSSTQPLILFLLWRLFHTFHLKLTPLRGEQLLEHMAGTASDTLLALRGTHTLWQTCDPAHFLVQAVAARLHALFRKTAKLVFSAVFF